jgi:hypothetical protein
VRKLSDRPVAFSPDKNTFPESASSSKPAICKSVDFPAPEGATKATISPELTEKLVLFKTLTSLDVPL